MYQLWLDDLYPRAKFADALAIIEKLGHQKRIQTMRREWINEGKPRDEYRDADVPHKVQKVPRATGEWEDQASAANRRSLSADGDRHESPAAASDEDLYSASPQRPQNKTSQQAPLDTTSTLFLPSADIDDQPPEDDLDALLAEQDSVDNDHSLFTSTAQTRNEDEPSSRRDKFDDDMEAMAELDIW